jgi:hypothetical protein
MENEIQVVNTEIVKDVQLESQIDIAKRYPRDLTRVINNSIAIVTMDKDTAETCNYSLPRGGKKLTGASVHLARIIVQQYGNLRVESRVTHADKKQVYAEAVCFDLESNVAVKATTSKSIIYSKGGRYNDDMIVVTGKAAAAIAYRNAVFSVIPKAIIDKVYNAAMREITGDLSTEEKLIKRRKAALDAFNSEYGVTEEEILKYLGLNTINQIKKDEIVTMLGMFNALKDGEYTVDNMFERKVKQETKPITQKEFDAVIKDLKSYNISLNAAKKKYVDSELTNEQLKQIEEAGTITDERLNEIIQLVIDEKKKLQHFEFYLTPEQMETVKNAIVDNEMQKANEK